MPAKKTFEERVDINGPQSLAVDGRCHVWTGGSERGYGFLWVKRTDGSRRREYAHIEAFERFFGKRPHDPNGIVYNIKHRCRNGLCVRPEHLFAVPEVCDIESRINRTSGPIVRPELGMCHVWTGGRRKGYGRTRLDGRKWVSIHVLLFEEEHGPLEDGQWVLHRCDNPSCVRVSHLFSGTVKDNVHDAIRKGRHKNVIGPPRKFSDSEIEEMRNMIGGGVSKKETADRFGISESYLSQIASGKARVSKGV